MYAESNDQCPSRRRKTAGYPVLCGEEDSSLEAELDDCITKIYEKYVPAQTREYIESMGGAERKARANRGTARDSTDSDNDEQ